MTRPLVCIALAWLCRLAAAKSSKQPNILIVLTDDQDWHMHSLDYMPLLNEHIIKQGTLFDKHYCTVSVCCPSRVNLWTGLAAHNSNVTDLFPPYGGYPKFVAEGLNENWLPVWLQKLGYQTYYTGKLFNSHSVDNYDDPPVNGFNGSDFLLDPFTYQYYHSRMTRNAGKPVSYEGQYSPDVVAHKALGFLDDAAQHDQPFFLVAAPVAPHSDVKFVGRAQFDMAKYAPRHAHLFKDYQIPREENFNPDVPSGVSWVRHLPQLNETVIEYHDEFQRSRLRALQSVDELIKRLTASLAAKGLLDNTYIFFTSDNGYHISQHRLPPGKECPFETDIHIPLAVRGPGVPSGKTANVISSHTDIAPTVLKLAGGDFSDRDGFPIPLTSEELAHPESGEHVNVEFWGRAVPEGKYGWIGNDTFPAVGDTGPIAARNNTYKALRLIGKSYNLMYTVWCTGEREFYDVQRDPSQMRNLLHADHIAGQASYELSGRSFEQVVARLDSLLMVTKSCKAATCHRPWSVLHPEEPVKTLGDALRPKYDDFYANQARVSFSSCPLGHLVAEEGPQDVEPWDELLQGQGSGGDSQVPLMAERAKRRTFEYGGPIGWWT
ncbi:hypothetical protein LTR95_000777 [Oleoguttula sp. CCFEE 5521]